MLERLQGALTAAMLLAAGALLALVATSRPRRGGRSGVAPLAASAPAASTVVGSGRSSTATELAFDELSAQVQHGVQALMQERCPEGCRPEWQVPIKKGRRTLPPYEVQGQPEINIKFKTSKDLNEVMVDYLDVAGGAGPGQGGPRIFCSIWTYDKNHATSAKAVWDTWAQRCDKFIAYSNKEDPSIGAIKISYPGDGKKLPNGKENMIGKSRAVWQHIARNHLLDFDYFIQGGDDNYFIMDNLRVFLRDPKWADQDAGGKPLYIGRPMVHNGRANIFNTGGAGQLLNRRALHMLNARFDAGACGLGRAGWAEDVITADCLRQLDIWPQDTRDFKKRELFHPFTPEMHLKMNMTQSKKSDPGGWFTRGSLGLLDGYDCCSPHSVAFHYCTVDVIYMIHRGLYGESSVREPLIL